MEVIGDEAIDEFEGVIPHHIPSNSLWIIIFSYQMYGRFSTQDSELCTFEELKGKKVQRAKLDLDGTVEEYIE